MTHRQQGLVVISVAVVLVAVVAGLRPHLVPAPLKPGRFRGRL